MTFRSANFPFPLALNKYRPSVYNMNFETQELYVVWGPISRNRWTLSFDHGATFETQQKLLYWVGFDFSALQTASVLARISNSGGSVPGWIQIFFGPSPVLDSAAFRLTFITATTHRLSRWYCLCKLYTGTAILTTLANSPVGGQSS